MIDSASGDATMGAERPSAAPDRSLGWFSRPSKRSSAVATEAIDDLAVSGAWIPVALAMTIALAFLFRLAAAEHLSSHVDEAASVMAAKMVAEKGVPLFPSGTLYTQGLTLSYILGPFIKIFGRGGLEDLVPLRLLSVFASTIAVFFAYKLAQTVTRSSTAGFVMALLLAIDPVSVRWAGMVRMYALLQCLSLIVIWLFVQALIRPPVRRRLIVMVAAFWGAVFTHIAVCLLFPGMILAALLIYGRSLQDRRRDLGVALAACAAAPVFLLGMNRLVSPPGKPASETLPGVSFVGDVLLSSGQFLNPSLRSWQLLFSFSPIGVITPILIITATCVLLGRYFLGEPSVSRGIVDQKRLIVVFLLLYWLPILAVALIATAQSERYLIHIHPIGILLVVMFASDVIGHPAPRFATQLAGARGALAERPWRRAYFSAAPQRLRLPAFVTTLRTGTAIRAPERVTGLASDAAMIGGFVGVLVIAAVVRLSHLNTLSLWLDEGFTTLFAGQTWRITAGLEGFYGPHPPLYFLLVKAVSGVTTAELAGRWVSVVAGIATIPVFALFMSRLFDRRAAITGTLVLALSPVHLYFSQEARMYALVVFFVALAYFAMVSFWRDQRWGWAVLFGGATTLAFWSDYSAVYAIVPLFILVLVLAAQSRVHVRPLVLAGVVSVLAYVPWMTQIVDSISTASDAEKRQGLLDASMARVFEVLLSIAGLSGDGDYFQAIQGTAWNRWPGLRIAILVLTMPVVVIAIRALWRQWFQLGVIVALFSTMIVGVWVSLIDPAFAERTVLATTLGWAALLGSVMSTRPMRHWLRLGAAASLGFVLLFSALTIDVLYNGALKQPWNAAAADVAKVAPLNYPVITYSFSNVADTLVDVYEPGALEAARLISIRDGALDDTLPAGIVAAGGITRTQDVAANRLAELLPTTPENGFVWLLSYPRTGENEVRTSLRRIGYTRVMHFTYPAGRYLVSLDLFARPDAVMGVAWPLDTGFSNAEDAWQLPETGTSVSPSPDGGGLQLSIDNKAAVRTEVFSIVNAAGENVVTLSVDLQVSAPVDLLSSGVPVDKIGVGVVCQTTSGAPAAEQTAEIQPVTGNAHGWRTVRVAVVCPDATDSIRINLRNEGLGNVNFRNPALHLMALPNP